MTADGPRVFFVAGEDSGDQLAARLMAALREAAPGVVFAGVGGNRMAAEGLVSLFPLDDIAVMGIGPVLRRLPTLLRRIRETAAAVVAAHPDVLVIVDSPDFTHRVARKVRAAAPDIAIVDYVSPSVWAWRPGRARKMAPYVDRLMALLPFEPAIHARLGGPPTSYVGHPLVDRPALYVAAPGERRPIDGREPPTLLVLPGSRSGEIDRMLGLYGSVIAALARRGRRFRLRIPAVDRLADRIAAETRDWVVCPEIVTGEAARWAAFRSAHAALATSGTVTLELALADVPTVVAYARDPLFRLVSEIIRRIPGQVQVKSFVLPDIILGENVMPQHLDPDLAPDALAGELDALLSDGPERRAQIAAFDRLRRLMTPPGGGSAAAEAAELVLAAIAGKRKAGQSVKP